MIRSAIYVLFLGYVGSVVAILTAWSIGAAVARRIFTGVDIRTAHIRADRFDPYFAGSNPLTDIPLADVVTEAEAVCREAAS